MCNRPLLFLHYDSVINTDCAQNFCFLLRYIDEALKKKKKFQPIARVKLVTVTETIYAANRY